MDVIGEIFKALKAKMQLTGLFTKVYGLVKLEADGSYTSYEGAGQGVTIGNFDNENGTAFFIMRSPVTIGFSPTPSPIPCQRLYSWTLPVRAVGVTQKNKLACDNATAGFQLSQGMIKEFYGSDTVLKTLINTSLLEIVPTGLDDKLNGVLVGNEYAIGVTDFNILLTTNIECLPGLCTA